jgi:hypothetical protein
MLAHCRQKHPDRLPFGGDTTTELVVTDIEGKVLSWEEMRQIIDDPSFWREPQGVVLWNRDQLLSVRIPALCPQPREADHTRDGGNRLASDNH